MRARGQAVQPVAGMLVGGPGHKTSFKADPRADTVLARAWSDEEGVFVVHSYEFDAELSARDGVHVFKYGQVMATQEGKECPKEILDLDAQRKGGAA